MDGLVSTGKINSLHNIKIYFADKEKKLKKFYSHFFDLCGKCRSVCYRNQAGGS